MEEASSGEGKSLVTSQRGQEGVVVTDQGRYEPPPGSPEEVRELVEKFYEDYSGLPFDELVRRMGKIYETMSWQLPRDDAQANFLKMARWIDIKKQGGNEAPREGNWKQSDSVRFKDALVKRGYIPAHLQQQQGLMEQSRLASPPAAGLPSARPRK